MAKAMYVKFDVPDDVESKALEAVELARDTGKIKKGTNETTKCVERGVAQVVLISENVEPPEVVAHLPPLCEEKRTPYIYVKTQNDLGGACGLKTGTSAAVIVDAGNSKDLVEEIKQEFEKLKGS
ncbi:MAG: 50S ribosomal protein L7Ae [Halobacteriota archaeon]|nr:50S ribosomal protein L7Ae [Halobacteriota archaeon]